VDTFRRLLGRLDAYRAAFLASLIAATIASVFDGLALVLLMPFLRLLFEGDATGTGLVTILGLILGAMVVKNIAHYIAVSVGASVQERVVRDLRVETYRALQTQALSFFQRHKAGDLITRLVADTEQVRTAVSLALASTVRNGVLVLVYLVILFVLSWRLALVTLVLAPALAIGMRPLFWRIRARAQAQVAARGELGAVAADALSGARVIKTQSAEAQEADRFARAAGDAAESAVRFQRVAFLASPLGEVFGTGVIMALLVLGIAWAGPGGPIRPEVFLTFLAITMRLLPPVKQIAQFPAQVGDALAAARRVFALLDRPPEDVDPPGAVPFPGLRDAMRFEDVHVTFPDGTEALRGVDLDVRRGEIVAITGPSGAGKSTLVDLLPRLIEPSAGRVLLDGVPVTAYTRDSLRRAIGYVGQETVIFHDTVRANIALGTPDATDADIERAARQAHAHGFIMALPRGYDTVLEERGLRLSGGERQRIALARVLLRDPEILILDEATSALDPESEQVVRLALVEAFAGRTVLVVAHRESTIAMAERRLTIDMGQLIYTPI
jgi:subfamily B ATP-binding cassette protein MsbA